MTAYLTPHFSLDELTASEIAARRGIDNTPTIEHGANLERLCGLLEQVRILTGRALLISSGYRSEALNRAVPGSPASQHCLGCAADFISPGFGGPRELWHLIRESESPHILYDQLILEFDRWVHLSIPLADHPPRAQAFAIGCKE